jgi:CHAT domain-containing protein
MTYDDGLLTAYKITLLNFSNTSLVVLTACNSGLGNEGSNKEKNKEGDEGVRGLQRVF